MIKHLILKALTVLSAVAAVTSLLSVDGPYWWQACICLLVFAGLTVFFAWAYYEQWQEITEDAADEK